MSATSKAPEGRAEVPLTVSKAKIDATSKQVEANVTLEPVHRLTIVPVDPSSGAAVAIGGGTVTLTPAEVSILDADAHVFEIVPGTAYAVKVTPKKTLYLETEQSGIATGKGGTRAVVKMNKRTTVLYVIIDRPEDAGEEAHGENRKGLAAAAAAFDPNLTVKFLKIEDIVGKTAKDLDDAEHPFAMFSGGSFSEWFQYGVDAKWKRALDAHMDILRTTEIPTLAVCGSHQLVAAAFHGFGAVAHMNDTPAGVHRKRKGRRREFGRRFLLAFLAEAKSFWNAP